jgi:hypothetical protein
MPILQSRLIDLLTAALDWKHAFEEKSRLMEHLARELSNPQLDALARYSANDYLLDPIKTNTTIAVEAERIKHTKRYNEARRESKRAKARLDSIPTIQSPEDIEELRIKQIEEDYVRSREEK